MGPIAPSVASPQGVAPLSRNALGSRNSREKGH